MWHKSSQSGPNGNCVELHNDLTAVRDSKRPGTMLAASRSAVIQLVSSASLWRKSSHSGPNGDCVELRNDLTAIRDSKRPETTLPATQTAIASLVSFARTPKPATP